MPTLYDIPAVMARYGCSRQMASKIIHSVPHLTEPRLMAPDWALREWEEAQMFPRKVKKTTGKEIKTAEHPAGKITKIPYRTA